MMGGGERGVQRRKMRRLGVLVASFAMVGGLATSAVADPPPHPSPGGGNCNPQLQNCNSGGPSGTAHHNSVNGLTFCTSQKNGAAPC